MPGRTSLPLLALLCLLPALSGADPAPLDGRRQMVLEVQEMIQQATADLDKRRAEQQRWLEQLSPADVSEAMVEQAQVEVEAARVEQESADIDLQEAQQAVRELESAIQEYGQRLQTLKSTPADAVPSAARADQVAALEAERARRNQALTIETEHLSNLTRVQALARERLRLAQERVDALSELRQAAELRNQQVAFEDLQTRLEQEQQKWLATAAKTRRDLEAMQRENPDPGRERLLTLRLQEAEEQARLLQMDLRIAQLRARTEQIELAPADADAEPKQLASLLEEVSTVSAEVHNNLSLLQRKIGVLERQAELVDKRREGGERGAALTSEGVLVGKLIRAHQERVPAFESLKERLDGRPAKVQAAYQASVHRGLWVRRSLPDDRAAWAELGREFATLPQATLLAVRQSGSDLLHAFTRVSPDRWLLLALVLLAWSGSMVALRRWAGRAASRATQRSSGFSDLLRIPREVLRGSNTALLIGGGGLITVAMSGVAPPSSSILFVGLGLWVSLVLALQLARGLLYSPQLPDARQHPRLFRQVRWFFSVGTVLAGITLLAHILTLAAPVQDLIDRAFMLYLMASILPTLEVRRLVLESLVRRLGERNWLGAVRLLSLPVPLAILLGTGVGLAGYANLAWAIGKYLGGFLVVLGLWWLLDRLLRDSITALKNALDPYSRQGQVWIKTAIEPLHGLTRLGLFVGLLLLPLYWLGVHSDNPALQAGLALLKTPLFSIGSKPVHVQGILFALLLALLVFRAGRWVRMVCYEWVFARIADLGIRHSLSVFSQYALVLAGVLVALRLFGIDLTTLAIFAGALGVGIGFGLQNIANNFISGFLLLLERPLRTSDIVRVGQHEGEVTHIGMRSITVKTWDHQEVIMPNADVISNAFINWTRSDDIVRTVLNIGIGYDSDPHRAKAVMEQVLQAHSATLRDPPPQVWLAEFDGAARFHVQYFINLRRHSRFEVRSEILLALWDALKAAGIKIPHSQQDIHIRSVPGAAPPSTLPAWSEPADVAETLRAPAAGG